MNDIESLISALMRKGVRLWSEDGKLRYCAPKGVLAQEQIHQIRARRDDFIKFLERVQGTAWAPLLLAQPRAARIPLSFAQERLWFLEQLGMAGTAYNIPSALHIDGELDVPALERSFAELICRHESLRTRFAAVDEVPYQIIDPPRDQRLEVRDFSGLDPAQRQALLQELQQQQMRIRFDLSEGPLLRVGLVKMAEHEHVLLLSVHHIISDGWSTAILTRELQQLYAAFSQGRPSPLLPLAVQYADYALWQRRWLQGEALERQLSY